MGTALGLREGSKEEQLILLFESVYKVQSDLLATGAV